MSQFKMGPVHMPFEVPKPDQVEEVRLSDGNSVLLRRHGNQEGPRLLLSHGNGFAVDMYYPMWGRFLDTFEVIVFDLRNHGWNPIGDIAGHNVPRIVEDFEVIPREVERRFGTKPMIGLYHSVSALAACLSSPRGEEYAGLFLLDPPICRPGVTYEELHDATELIARRTRRREIMFESLKQCAELFRWSPAYKRTVDGACQLAARATLCWDSEALGFVLRCPREYEALIMEYLSVFTVLVNLDEMRCPVRILGADPTLPFAFLPSYRLDELMTCSYDFVPNATHMLFLERPDICATRFVEFIEDSSLV
ncbi:MAG: alpha/beta hydrolase [Bryobacterales bacterium]|nr:alpha/beta hydrolase [Bryobacterales bacterium]MDE0625434.1 alpha/beta hydrolase [Bryobacterales bacterium]